MAKKTTRQGKGTASVRAVTSTPTGRQNVILERIEEQQRVVIDAVVSNREALERRMDDHDQKLSTRIDALEFAVRSLAADVRQNSADIRHNTADIVGLGEKLDTKADTSQLVALEARVEGVESSG